MGLGTHIFYIGCKTTQIEFFKSYLHLIFRSRSNPHLLVFVNDRRIFEQLFVQWILQRFLLYPLFLSLSLSLSVSLCLCLSLSLSVSLCLSLSLSISLLFSLLTPTLSLSLSLYHSLCLSFTHLIIVSNNAIEPLIKTETFVLYDEASFIINTQNKALILSLCPFSLSPIRYLSLLLSFSLFLSLILLSLSLSFFSLSLSLFLSPFFFPPLSFYLKNMSISDTHSYSSAIFFYWDIFSSAS